MCKKEKKIKLTLPLVTFNRNTIKYYTETKHYTEHWSVKNYKVSNFNLNKKMNKISQKNVFVSHVRLYALYYPIKLLITFYTSTARRVQALLTACIHACVHRIRYALYNIFISHIRS